ncbi:MAG: transcriptional regulator [Bryobacterales bacterium]|jgi:ubiquinone/menaquinone biosynthesis C-methylase UbiE/DNA-binding transcriptional ArsR family regulator|nr:transcriptional regulator [Bryobacterales bacterium]
MASILKSLRLLADPSRIRIVLLLEREELSVAELQEILAMGQSTISTHLAQLKQAGIVEDRRTGKNILYRLKAFGNGTQEQVLDVLRHAVKEIPEAGEDRDALRLALQRRQDKVRSYFDELAGKFGRQYVPGRSWQGLAETFLMLMPPLVIADLGAGEGTVSQLLARRAKKVIAVDNSEKMVEFGSSLARSHGVKNLEYRLGDIEDLPLKKGEADVAFFSQSLHHAQHPPRALAEAFRIVKPGGRVIILDLLKHHFEEARALYADVWLGFSEVELRRMLGDAGFQNISTALVHREAEAPHFETILAAGDK